MPHAPADPTPVEPTPETERVVPAPASPPPAREAEHPRLIEEHHARGPYGEDELEATDELGRRWYHLRPEPRRRYDVIGFNYTWWLIWIFVIFLVFLPWGHGWGY